MTFGIYIRELLDEKNINISKLAAEIDIKSKNEIYRLFENKHSYEKSKDLTERILSAVSVSADEKVALYSLMKDLKTKKGIRQAREILAGLYRKKEPAQNKSLKAIEELLKSHSDSEIKIFMGSDTSTDTALFFDNFLAENESANISLIHSVNFNKTEETIARELFSIIVLMPHDRYNGFEVQREELKGLMGFVDDGKEKLIFTLTGEDEFAQSIVSDEFYALLLVKYERYVRGKPVKQVQDKFVDYAYFMKLYSPMDGSDVLAFVGTVCYGDIPFEISYRVFKDANYFGLSPAAPMAVDLIETARARHETRKRSAARHRFILDTERMRQFFAEGRTVDHIDGFRSLTKEEIAQTWQYRLDMLDFKYRFYKPEYSARRLECLLVDGMGLITVNASLGYGKNNFYGGITHPKALSVYRDFAEYFWDNCTMSEEESEKIIDEMIDKYLR